MERIEDAQKLRHVSYEFDVLGSLWAEAALDSPKLQDLRAKLKAINESLWEIEDDIRILESQSDFGERFIALARSVYLTNDRRASVKKEINQYLGSDLVEEKSYADYQQTQS